MAQPPAGSSLLFGALADSGRIKQRKNGSYLMVLEGVDEIDWFTDRPDRFAGEWSPKKLVKKWDGLFGGVEPNAQATFEMGSKRELVTFEMFKPKLTDSNQTLSFKVRGISKKNKDLLTGLRNKQLSDASLFIDDSLPACLFDCQGANLRDADLFDANLSEANLTGADMRYAYMGYANLFKASMSNAILKGADLRNADLRGADLSYTNLDDARLNYAKLTNAYLWDANLTGADLTNATLDEAHLDGAAWNNTTCPDGTKNSGTSPCTAEQLSLI